VIVFCCVVCVVLTRSADEGQGRQVNKGAVKFKVKACLPHLDETVGQIKAANY
jgi:hypothetical protein